jgi:hypothetical protein
MTGMGNYGIAHVWAEGDFVTRGIAVALLIMSVLSWTVIVIRSWDVMRPSVCRKDAEQAFWRSDDFNDGVKKLGRDTSSPAGNPCLASALSGQEAADHHHRGAVNKRIFSYARRSGRAPRASPIGHEPSSASRVARTFKRSVSLKSSHSHRTEPSAISERSDYQKNICIA